MKGIVGTGHWKSSMVTFERVFLVERESRSQTRVRVEKVEMLTID